MLVTSREKTIKHFVVSDGIGFKKKVILQIKVNESFIEYVILSDTEQPQYNGKSCVLCIVVPVLLY